MNLASVSLALGVQSVHQILLISTTVDNILAYMNQCPSFKYIFKINLLILLFYLFIYLFILAALGLRCCAQAFP